MTKIFSAIALILLITQSSCSERGKTKPSDEGKLEGNTFSSDAVGWTIQIPTGWTVIAKDEINATNEKGLKAIEETTNTKVDASGLRNLISLRKDKFNVFQSTSEPYKSDNVQDWQETNASVKKVIYQTYADQGIRADSSASSVEIIDGLKFNTYSFTLYGPNGEVILNQRMYSRLINGYDFGVNINYNNEKDRNELISAFKASKFKSK